jgi:hypothetical protein
MSKCFSLNLSIHERHRYNFDKKIAQNKRRERIEKTTFCYWCHCVVCRHIISGFWYTDFETYEEQNSAVIANESRTISNNDYYAYYRDFEKGEQLELEFTAASDLSIWVETDTEYYKFTSSQSHSGIWAALDVKSAEATVTIPDDDVYYIVVYNEKTHSVNYDLKVTEHWTTLETREITRYRADYTLNYVGVAIVFAGVILTVVGAVTKPLELEDYEDDEELSTLQTKPITPTSETDSETELLEDIEEVPSEIICPNCASEVDAGNAFCPDCGSQL